MPNHLSTSTSPYLKQHRDNPVDWYPWGEEAIRRAKADNKPIFLSIGYAACHWCHVMAHESFEDPQTANILNRNFICIKVDREERPDLDDIYMQAVVLIAGRGGWPLSVFLKPDLKPFYGGTYFPPFPRFGMPSFKQILQGIINAWRTNPDGISKNAKTIIEAVETQQGHFISGTKLPDLDATVKKLFKTYDWEYGGWSQAPKFPQPMLIEFLIQRALNGDFKAKELVEHNLNQLSRGGLFDLVGGGFHRYSTDRYWLIPHFEKMLYDNAQLALAFVHGYALTGNPVYRWIAEKTLDFICTEMTHPLGGFFASLDADTPDGEGRYYSWSISSLRETLSDQEYTWLEKKFNLTTNGNFESGMNVLQLDQSIHKIANTDKVSVKETIQHLELILKKLHEARSKRTPPNIDTKIISTWNALTINAFVQAGRIFNNPEYIKTAQKAGDFILKNLISENGHIMRNWNEGFANQPGTLSDIAGTILAFYQLYELSLSPKYYQALKKLHQSMHSDFSTEGVFYNDVAKHVPNMVLRPSKLQDSVTPSGNALACHVHWLLYQLDMEPSHDEKMISMLRNIGDEVTEHPHSFGYWLQIADLSAQNVQQIVLVTSDDGSSILDFTKEIHKSYNPFRVVAAKYGPKSQENDIPTICQNRTMINGKSTAYICEDFTCQLPITDFNTFKNAIRRFQVHKNK